LSVTDSSQPTALSYTATYTITVNGIGIAQAVPSATAGSSFADLTGQGGSGTYNWVLAQGSNPLPPGLSLSATTPDSNTGALTGNPTFVGTYSFTVTATDATDATSQATETFTVTVIAPSNLAIIQPGAAYIGSSFSGLSAAGGNGPYAWGVQGTLPTGITAAASTDALVPVLTGTPTSGPPASYPLTVTVTDSTPAAAGGPLTLTTDITLVLQGFVTVPGPQPGFVLSGAPGGIVGQPYGGSQGGGVQVAGTGTAPYFWTLTAGVLPPGLAENAETGYTDAQGNFHAFYLTGTPTTAGTWSFTVQIQDSTPPTQGGPLTLQQTFVLSVARAQSFIPSSTHAPWGLTLGPDGQYWFGDQAQTAQGFYQIGEVTSGGQFNYQDASQDFYQLQPVLVSGQQLAPEPFQLALSQDQSSVWFLEPIHNHIGQISTYGSAPFQYSTASAVPNSSPSIPEPLAAFGVTTAGPQGSNDAWVTLGLLSSGAQVSGILQISSSSHGTNFYPLTDPNFVPQGITWNAADGAFWFTGTLNSQGYIGRMLPDGTMSPPAACSAANTNGVGACPIPGTQMSSYSSQQYANIAVGPDGQTLWFTDPQSSQIGSITPDAKTISSFTTPTSGAVPTAIVSGPDNALWFTEFGSGQIGRLDPATGAISEFPVSTANGPITPASIISANGSLWVADYNNSIIQIIPPFALTCNFSNMVVGTATSAQCNALAGSAPYSYFVDPTTLPPGITASSTPGTFSGTPTLSGTYTFTVQASDHSSPPENATLIVTVKVSVPKLTLTGCDFSTQALAGSAYMNSNCVPQGGERPYNFSISAGALPNGLTLNPANGVVSGTPTTVGTYNFTIQVQDSGDANTPPQTAIYAATLLVNPPPLTVSCNFSAVATVGATYSTSCPTANGVSPFAFSVIKGALPPGLTLDASQGSITGKPSAFGTFNFTIQVVDSSLPVRTASQIVAGFVVQPASLTVITTALPKGSVGLPYSGNSFAGGGTPPYTWSVSSGALPPGLSLNANAGAVAGTPTLAGSYQFGLIVSDNTGASSAPQAIQVVISGPVQPTFTEFPLPQTASGASTGADSIVTGPDGNLWFTTPDQSSAAQSQPLTGLIGSISTLGVVGTEYRAPAALAANPTGGNITAGPDGNLWFAESDGDGIGQITTAGVRAGFAGLAAAANPQQIVTALDGALWFTETAANQIGRITTGGVVKEYAVTTPTSQPVGIALGSDGAIWFTEEAVSQIGRYDPATNRVTEFATPTGKSHPIGIAAGPDGALWFTESTANIIGRIPIDAHSSADIAEYPLPAASSGPQAITAASSDGVLWFTELSGNRIGRITTNGVITEYSLPTNSASPIGITIGPDGAVWFTENAASQIGTLNLVPQLAVSCNFPIGPVQAGTTYSGTCSASGGTAPYTYSISAGQAPYGVTIDASSGILSGTLTGAGTFIYTVEAIDSSSPVQTATVQSPPFVVTPLPITLSCNFPTAIVGAAYDGSCTAVQGTPPYQYSIVGGSLPAGFALNTTTGAVTGVPSTPGSFSVTAQVTDAGSPAQTTTAAASISVEFGNTTSTGGSLFTFSGFPASVTPDQDLTNLSVTLNQSSPVPLSAVLELGFTPFGGGNSGINDPNPSPVYIDPALQFLDTNGNGIGTKFTLTIPPGTTSLSLPPVNVGTVAGTISLAMTMNGFTQIDPTLSNSQTVLPTVAPVIEPGSVQITNATATGFDVELIANSSPRSAISATYVFTPATGSQLTGLTTFSIDVSSLLLNWFESDAGLKYGSRFSLKMPFMVNGPMNAIQSVSVTLTNSAGASSAVTSGK
jgi:streptogramin lyase